MNAQQEHDEAYELATVMNILDGWLKEANAEFIYGLASEIVSALNSHGT